MGEDLTLGIFMLIEGHCNIFYSSIVCLIYLICFLLVVISQQQLKFLLREEYTSIPFSHYSLLFVPTTSRLYLLSMHLIIIQRTNGIYQFYPHLTIYSRQHVHFVSNSIFQQFLSFDWFDLQGEEYSCFPLIAINSNFVLSLTNLPSIYQQMPTPKSQGLEPNNTILADIYNSDFFF